MLSWVFLIAPFAHDAALPLSERVIRMVYPFANLVLLGVSVRLAVSKGARTMAFSLLLLAMLASLFSNFGGLIQSVGASWLMTSLSPTADIVALVQASTVLPYMLFCLAAGAAAHVLGQLLVVQPGKRLPALPAAEQLGLERAVAHLLEERAEERLRDPGAGLVDHLVVLGFGHAFFDVAADVLPRVEPGLLREVADAAPRPLVHRQVGDVVAVERDRPAVGGLRTDGLERRAGRPSRHSAPASNRVP